MIGFNGSPVDVTFGTATNQIVVFDNIDHPGQAWDVFQYEIFGSNNGGSSFTQLFDPKTVLGPDLSGNFLLNTYDGTAPTLLNNYVTPGPGSSQGNVGYEEYFTFATSYNYYRFLPSTLTRQTGENELELSAVGIATPSQTIVDTAETPEPVSFLMAFGGLAVLFTLHRRRFAI